MNKYLTLSDLVLLLSMAASAFSRAPLTSCFLLVNDLLLLLVTFCLRGLGRAMRRKGWRRSCQCRGVVLALVARCSHGFVTGKPSLHRQCQEFGVEISGRKQWEGGGASTRGWCLNVFVVIALRERGNTRLVFSERIVFFKVCWPLR